MSALLTAAALPRPVADPDAAYRTADGIVRSLREAGHPASWERYADYLEILRGMIANNRLRQARTVYEVGLMAQDWPEEDVRQLGRRFDAALYSPRRRTELMRALSREINEARTQDPEPAACSCCGDYLYADYCPKCDRRPV